LASHLPRAFPCDHYKARDSLPGLHIHVVERTRAEAFLFLCCSSCARSSSVGVGCNV
jgi:hypothetical protein